MVPGSNSVNSNHHMKEIVRGKGNPVKIMTAYLGKRFSTWFDVWLGHQRIIEVRHHNDQMTNSQQAISSPHHPQGLYALREMDVGKWLHLCPPVRSSILHERHRFVLRIIILETIIKPYLRQRAICQSRVPWQREGGNIKTTKKNRSDKAETWNDRFHMMIKLGECLSHVVESSLDGGEDRERRGRRGEDFREHTRGTYLYYHLL